MGAEVVEAAAVPLLAVTKIQHNGVTPSTVGPADKLIHVVLNRLALESSPRVCGVLAQLVSGLVNVLGLGVARWVDSLATVMVSQLDQAGTAVDASARLLLDMWAQLSQLVPGCAGRQTVTVLPSLVRLMYRWSYCLSTDDEAVQAVCSCLVAVSGISPSAVLHHCRGLDQLKVNNTFHNVVNKFMEAAKEKQEKIGK